jgi:signal transduction histidine kinase
MPAERSVKWVLSRAFAAHLSARAAAPRRRATALRWVAVAVVTLLTMAAAVIAVRAGRRITGPLGDVVRARESAERERRLAARLTALETAKTDFMSTVSHELRTPLTSISGYLELIMDSGSGSLSAAQVRMLEVIGRNAVRLRELVEDMLTLADIESGDFRTETEPMDLTGVIDRTIAAAGPQAEKASVGLHPDVRGPLPITGDPVQLDRVLSNLLANAVKFTGPDGTVTVHAERRGDDVVLTVADTGIGIPADEQQALFTRFFRATNAIHKAVPGTGLGLAIVRTIVEQHGGTIEITSTENVGTTATVRLPAAEPVSSGRAGPRPGCSPPAGPGSARPGESR